MSKKKNKKGKFGGLFGWVGSFFAFLVRMLVKMIPLAFVVAAFLFGAFGIKKILLADTHLRVQEVRLVPADVLSPQSLRILEGKILGKNILSIDLKKIASQIELGPGAQSVRVIREMPSTIRIEIRKRKPAASVLFRPGGNYGIVADDGVIIATTAMLDPAWIFIEDFSEPYKEPKIGARIQNKGFGEALRFLELYNSRDISRKEKITRVTLDAYGNVTVRLGEGPDFQLGRRPSEKIGMIPQAIYLFKNEPRENVEYMDLQFDRVAVKRKQP
jgi:hypothetical protein